MKCCLVDEFITRFIKYDDVDLFIPRFYGSGHPSHEKWRLWSDIVESHFHDDYVSLQSFEEICEKLYELSTNVNISGINGDDIIRTASYIADKLGINPDDSCYNSDVFQYISSVNIKSIETFLDTNSILYQQMNKTTRVKFILKNIRPISSLLKQIKVNQCQKDINF